MDKESSIFDSLEDLVNLEPGWDDDGTDPPTTESLGVARTVISAGLYNICALPHRIDPSVVGGVVVEYNGMGRRYCLFECYNDGETCFVGSLGDGHPFVYSMNDSKIKSSEIWSQISDFCNGKIDKIDFDPSVNEL